MKRVLLINPFDSLPGESHREHRYTILFNKLKKVADVTWISSTFQHYSHDKRNKSTFSAEDRQKIVLVPMHSYRKNVSLKRSLSYSLLSVRTLFTVLGLKKKPDIIVCWGPVELVYFMSLYAKYNKIKIIIDVIDVWPDIFVLAFPKSMRFLGNIFLMPYFFMSKKSLSLATHITSVSKSYTEWALRRGRRKDVHNSSYYFLGCNTSIAQYNYSKSRSKLKCLFAGQFSFNYDVETIAAVARKLDENKIRNIEFILAGDGYKKDMLLRVTSGLDNVKFTGWITPDVLNNIALECHIGLCSYTRDATQSVPYKVFDYMSMGLFILNSLKGEMEDFISCHQIGESYESCNIDHLYKHLIKLSSTLDDVITTGYNALYLFKNKFHCDTIYDNMINDIILINDEK